VKVNIPATKFIDLPVAAADDWALVRFGDAIHYQIWRKADAVAFDCTARVRQNIQAWFMRPDNPDFIHDLKRGFMHGFDIIVG
jgi:hypothetical protein